MNPWATKRLQFGQQLALEKEHLAVHVDNINKGTTTAPSDRKNGKKNIAIKKMPWKKDEMSMGAGTAYGN